MDNVDKKYTCINCGVKLKELYKVYSPTVLKLTTCDNCSNVADKYIEHDPATIIIDLILLSKEAYRHVIFNTDFKVCWKLAILLQVVEAFSDWTTSRPYSKSNSNLEGVHVGNLAFHKTFVKVSIQTTLFILSMCTLTWVYNRLFRRNSTNQIPLVYIWKCCILSSFGIVLFLPSLIWGQSSIQEFHIIFVSLYTTFSQLLAYKVVCNCHKLWSILVVLISYYIKIVLFDQYKITEQIFAINYNYTTNI